MGRRGKAEGGSRTVKAVVAVDGNASAGRLGERIASDYLQLRGCTILEKNFRCGHVEIDLIVRDGPCIVFVEVKLRSCSAFGGALGAVGRAKLARLRRAARFYLASSPGARAADEYRFDLVALDLDPRGEGMTLVHLKGIT